MRQARIHERFTLFGKTEFTVERHGDSLRIHIHLPVVVRTGVIEQRLHDRRADFLLAPLRQYRDTSDMPVGKHPPATDGIALKA